MSYKSLHDKKENSSITPRKSHCADKVGIGLEHLTFSNPAVKGYRYTRRRYKTLLGKIIILLKGNTEL